MTLTLVIDGERFPQHLPKKGSFVMLSKSGSGVVENADMKLSAGQGHGWPGEDQGRDYGGLTSNPAGENVKKRKDVPYY